ncbi:MAG: hypothetical protein FK733_15295 [Asgard group archaeon]|nr:hypothetical protein [Asgard group archaeon]
MSGLKLPYHELILKYQLEKKSTGISFLDFLCRKGISSHLQSHLVGDTMQGGLELFGIHSIFKFEGVKFYQDRMTLTRRLGKRGDVYLNQIQSVDERFIYRRNEYGVKVLVNFILELTLNDNSVVSIHLYKNGDKFKKNFYDYFLYYNPEIKLLRVDMQKHLNEKLKLAFSHLATNITQVFDIAVRLFIFEKGLPRIWKIMALLTTVLIPEESLPFITKALSLQSQDPDLWICKGLASEQMGDVDQAKFSYETALKRNKYHPLAKANLERLMDNERTTTTQDTKAALSLLLEKVDQFKREIKPDELKVSRKDIKLIEELIGTKKTIELDVLAKESNFPKEKVEEIATKHLDFTLKDGLLSKKAEKTDRNRRLRIEQIEHLIDSKNKPELSYILAVTRLPKDEVVEIIEKELGYKIENDVIYTEK